MLMAMYFALLFWLATSTEALAHWEPCKHQCENNYKRNEIVQPSLITVCKRGCDLFTVALISTSHPSSPPPIERQQHDTAPHEMVAIREGKRIIVISPTETDEAIPPESLKKQFDSLLPKGESFGAALSSTVFKDLTNGLTSKILSSVESKELETENSIPKPPSTKSKQGINLNSLRISNQENDSNKVSQSQPLSKTTEEPTSQPVQDHPVEASKQTTTPKGPKRENPKFNGIHKVAKMLLNHKELKTKTQHPNAIPLSHAGIPELGDSTELNEESFRDYSLEQRIEQAKHSCRHACVTAYGGASEQEACVVGCHLQATTAALKPIEEDKTSPKSPIAVFQHVVFSLANHVGRLVRITWSLASSSSVTGQEEPSAATNKVQVYGSEVLTRQAQVPMFIGLRQSFNMEGSPKRPEGSKMDSNHGMTLMNGGMFHLPRPMDRPSNELLNMPGIITILKEEAKEERTKSHPEEQEKFQDRFKKIENVLDDISDSQKRPMDHRRVDHQNTQPQLDLLECISRKSGLPRWFIAIAIFASALVVLWLCFSLTAPPDDIKVVKRKPPMNECPFEDDDDDFDDDGITCSEKKKLLARADDIIKIRIENV